VYKNIDNLQMSRSFESLRVIVVAVVVVVAVFDVAIADVLLLHCFTFARIHYKY